MERKIILALDFDLRYTTPITFLERYQRLLSVDFETEDKGTKQIGHTARTFCKYMQRNLEFLDYTPAQQSSAALLLSINLSYSQASELIGLTYLGEKFILSKEETTSEQCKVNESCDDDCNLYGQCNVTTQSDIMDEGPLSLWSAKIAKLTSISARRDIAPVYVKLVALLNEFQFNNKLKSEPKVWLSEPEPCDKRIKVLNATKRL